MPDLVSDGTTFTCPFCTSKLKLTVSSSCATGDSKNIANENNGTFLPPGGTCNIDFSPCTPSATLIKPGQTCVKVSGSTALGANCMFLCAKGGAIKVDSSGQSIAKHDEASTESRISKIWNGVKSFYEDYEVLIDIASLFIPGPEEVVIGKYGAKILGIAGKATVKGAKKAGKAVAIPAPKPRKQASKISPEAKKLADKEAVKEYWVYRSKDGKYVGITKGPSIERRAAEHMTKTQKEVEKGLRAAPREIEEIPGIGQITKKEARGVEQTLIDHYGLEKNGGRLENQINSISPKRTEIYNESKKIGEEILKNAGHELKKP